MLILRLRGKEGPLKDTAESFKTVLGGDVTLEPRGEPRQTTRMIYKFKLGDRESSVDIIHAASMVKELGPLYLIVKELVHPGDYLIIEEPESHLHPWAQCKLVEIFAQLVHRQVNLVITTHSDLFLRKVAHLVGMSRVEGTNASTSLARKHVAIYLLKEDDGGSVSQRLEIPIHGALESLPTYDEIIKELYEEEVFLQTKLQGEKS
jgi:predicted ATPase